MLILQLSWRLNVDKKMAKIDMATRELGQRIGKIRRYKGYSEDYMAKRLGVSQRQYSRYETGESPLATEKLTEVCEALEVSEEFLLNFDEKYIFSHCNGAMSMNSHNEYHAASEKERQLYEDLIKQLKEENAYLRKQLETALSSKV